MSAPFITHRWEQVSPKHTSYSSLFIYHWFVMIQFGTCPGAEIHRLHQIHLPYITKTFIRLLGLSIILMQKKPKAEDAFAHPSFLIRPFAVHSGIQ